jgi:uncharacterized protein YecA (UPF0149 family)
MDTNTGRIFSPEEIKRLQKKGYLSGQAPAGFESLVEMKQPPTPVQLARRPPRVGRNEPCPCGSGRKFKHCCFTGQ